MLVLLFFFFFFFFFFFGLFYGAICFMSYLVDFPLVISVLFSIAITSLGEERAKLSAFPTFIRLALVWICLFPLPFGVWEGLRFVIVALPGLFSYLIVFFHLFGFVCFLFFLVSGKRYGL